MPNEYGHESSLQTGKVSSRKRQDIRKQASAFQHRQLKAKMMKRGKKLVQVMELLFAIK